VQFLRFHFYETLELLAKAVVNASKDVKDVILDVCNRPNEMISTFLAQTTLVIVAAKN
jgi:hypothetical protein